MKYTIRLHGNQSEKAMALIGKTNAQKIFNLEDDLPGYGYDWRQGSLLLKEVEYKAMDHNADYVSEVTLLHFVITDTKSFKQADFTQLLSHAIDAPPSPYSVVTSN